MLQTRLSAEKLFAKSVPVSIKDGYTNQNRNCKLLLTVEWKEVTSTQRRELFITLTDNVDPFFLYHLQLSEEDFQSLKTSQGLLVDYFAFPQNFIDYLELCLAEEKNAQPKFLLIFNVNEKIGSSASIAQLNVMETNRFKLLMHLSLKFAAATESSVKQYLADCLTNLKEEKQLLQSQLTYLEQKLKDEVSRYKTSLDQKVEELDHTRGELTTELSMKENKHSRELQEEREKFLTRQREEEIRVDRELKDKEFKFRQEIQQLESRISTKDTLNKELQDKIHKQDSTIRGLKSRISSLEEENKRNGESLRVCKSKIENYEFDLRDKTTQLCNQRDRLESLEDAIGNKDQQIHRLKQHLEQLEKHEEDLKEELSDLDSQYRKSKKVSDQLREDISKGNRVIEKLQSEIQNVCEKLKHSKITVAKQEQSILEKDKVIQMLQKDFNAMKPDLRKKNSEVKSLSETIESLQERVKTLENEVKTRDNVVKYLNRQLSEQCIIPQYEPPPNLVTPSLRPQTLRFNGGGGDLGVQDTQNNHSVPIEKSRLPISSRDVNYSALRSPVGDLSSPALKTPRSLQQVTGRTTDSAHASPPPSNTRIRHSTPGDINDNAGDFEMDSAALNAAFGSVNLKQSIAKKTSNTRTTNINRKRS